ncbi:kinesin protein KIF18B-like [Tropilaelaps mercedesae]|uniref:Kinesin-like protein n=1 Tax=Tropilaelaps mercedesae TaxID=418985 RepID=A0A1V9X3Z5_9ACAR|nr:kinesin protein KIF18B-like [Tropilaelaps mercedesae]
MNAVDKKTLTGPSLPLQLLDDGNLQMAPNRRSLKRAPSRRSTRRSVNGKAASQLANVLYSEVGNQDLESPSATRIELSKGRMAVAVRIRPLSAAEEEHSQRRVVSAFDERQLIFDPKSGYDDLERQPRVQGSKIVSLAEKNQQFEFDRVFDEACDNHKVYEDTVVPLLASFLDGFNCSVFAYGATGSGKTHTMMGQERDRGIVSLTMERLFAQLEGLESDNLIEVQASYFEIYNENILDLLRPGKSEAKSLDIRESGKNVFISGLSYHAVTTMEQILELIEEGSKRRSQSETQANAKSSRSHAIFQINLKITNKTTRTLQESKMSLIDLAGSERAAGVNKSRDRFKEGTNINKSLLALGNCINALAENKKAHVPYRDSKLTRILKDSLGGTAVTLMIAAISPSHGSYETTHKTLLYAQRARKIQTTATKNQNKVALGGVTNYMALMNTLTAQLQSAQAQTAQLRKQLQAEQNHSAKLQETIEDLQTELTSTYDLAKDVRNNTSVEDDSSREVASSRTDVADRYTEELFRQVIRARNREIEAIAAVKQAQFSRALGLPGDNFDTLLRTAQMMGQKRVDMERMIADARTKISSDAMSPLDSRYLHDTTQREMQETQNLAARIVQMALKTGAQVEVPLTRFLAFDNTDELEIPLPISSPMSAAIHMDPPSTPMRGSDTALNQTFSKFLTPPVPAPRSAIKTNTITKQTSASTVPFDNDAQATGSIRAPSVGLASKVRRVLIRSQSSRTLGDNNHIRQFPQQPQLTAKSSFLKKPTWK